MKHLVYLGNKLSSAGRTQSTIDTLSTLLRAEGFTVTTASKQTNKVLRLCDMLWTILRHAKQADYVLIDTYSTQNFYYAYLCALLCRFLRLPYIPILHGGNLPQRLESHPQLSASLFKKAFINSAPSNYIKAAFERLGYTNVKCIPNSIILKAYPFKERNIQTINLLWVRSFSEIYNPKLAIRVLHGLLERGITATLCMVGPEVDGTLAATKSYAKALKVTVTFTGQLSKAEWIALSQDYNVFINTTDFDNMPVSVIEAMALGLTLVSTNVGGLPYLIDNNITGVLVPPNNADAFIEALLVLRQDRKNTAAMVSRARAQAAVYDWNSVKKLWLAHLK
ncbi:glycosyltransferase family 4 protein [Bizionia saleffrena]|uniref:Glycosyltransferase family 4 protein n=1 Tax=Bizionia saleffrena TaxID=291189 RepID=A0A8H2LGN3_9FLAO|nr:glycosyltransferase family 4 protein [Bizionia saleffrena]TYB80152.1 glycosyltransferase family 4 protein [Bizionia saleffrena]